MTIKTKPPKFDEMQTPIIVEPLSGYGVNYVALMTSEPVAISSHVAPQPALRTARLGALLSSETGVTLQDVCAAFGWQPHSARAALSGLRKSGNAAERFNFAVGNDGTGSLAKGLTRYRITLAGRAAS